MSTKASGILRRRRIIRLAAYQDDACFHCQRPMRLLLPDHAYAPDEANAGDCASLDHATPLSAGGTNRIENLFVAHRSCNSARHHAPLSDADRVRLNALNAKRQPLIDAQAGAQCAATFGIATPASATLAVILDGLSGHDGKIRRERINSILSRFTGDLAQLDHVPDPGRRRFFAKLVLHEAKSWIEALGDHESRTFALNVLVGLARRHGAATKAVATTPPPREDSP